MSRIYDLKGGQGYDDDDPLDGDGGALHPVRTGYGAVGPGDRRRAVEGTQAAVELCLSIAGMLCLWTGVMEVMRRSGWQKSCPGCFDRCSGCSFPR